MPFSFVIKVNADHSVDSLLDDLRRKHTINGVEKFKFGAQKCSLVFEFVFSRGLNRPDSIDRILLFFP